MALDRSHSLIEDLYGAWSQAFLRQDINAIAALLTPDYQLWAPGVAAQGVQELRPRFAAAFATHEITPAFECEERIVADYLAFDRGWDVQTLRARASGVESLHRQRVFLLLRQGRDGRWRFARAVTQPGPT